MKTLRSRLLRAFASCVLAASFAHLLPPRRVSAQEPEDTGGRTATPATERKALEERLEELEGAKAAHEEATRSILKEQERLEQRVEELETQQGAQEDATRWIIRDAVSSMGSRINEYVSLGGTLEVVAGWGQDVSGQSDSVIELSTAQLEFEVVPNDWTLGSLILEYQPATDVVFPTTDGFSATVDRLNIDTAFLTIGDPLRFPPFGTFGRMVVPFGISTGDPVADVLTIEDPLTLEVFEMREDAILLGLGLPTPAVKPDTPPVTPPTVRPLVLNPLISGLSRRLGYNPPPTRPPRPTLWTPAPTPPLFNGGVYFFNGDTYEGDSPDPTDAGWSPGNHIGATLGFRTQGTCRGPYRLPTADEPRPRWWVSACPWSLDVDVDFNGSVFDSQFLEFGYQRFLNQIGFVPGMAASVKGTIGPISLTGEWNGAISSARFTDDLGRLVDVAPQAWQLSLGYQFDWNPWVDEIGAQGDYLAIGYSESTDLAGVSRLIDGEPVRTGFVPRRRFLVSVGEWVLDGVRVAVEYSHNVDYSTSEGGTGESANGVFTMLTLVW